MIHSAAKIVTLIETAGLKPGAIARLLRPIGVDPADLFDFDRSFTLAQVIAIFHAVLEASDDPTVAFRAGSRFKFTNFGVFGLAVMSQDDLRAALKFVLKFRQLSSPIIGLHLETGETGGDLHFSPLPGTVSDREIYPRLLDFNLAMFLALIADAIGRDDFVEAIELSERADALTFDQLAQAGHRVIRGAGRDVIRLKPWSLAAPLRQKSAVGSAIAQKLCSEALTSMPDKSKLASDVRAVIVANVEKPVTAAFVARRLGMGERSLRRRLTEENLSFRDLKMAVQDDVARRYLQQTRMPIETIAGAVGFSDVANFRRAFRRLHGITPQAYRKAPGQA